MQFSLRMLIIAMLLGGPLAAWGWRRWDDWRKATDPFATAYIQIHSGHVPSAVNVPTPIGDSEPSLGPKIEYPEPVEESEFDGKPFVPTLDLQFQNCGFGATGP